MVKNNIFLFLSFYTLFSSAGFDAVIEWVEIGNCIEISRGSEDSLSIAIENDTTVSQVIEMLVGKKAARLQACCKSPLRRYCRKILLDSDKKIEEIMELYRTNSFELCENS